MELVVGGELFNLLRAKKKFSESETQFFAAEVASALFHLHSMLIVFRDLKPENILVHRTGHIKLTDFGFAKYLKGEKTKTVCGTSEYMAPEIIKKEAYGLSVDWWSYGVLVYEMLVGKSPFNDADESQVLALALSARVTYPVFISKPSKDFIGRLLNKSPTRRLGAPEIKDTHTIQGHAFFKSLEWSKVLSGRLSPPFPPEGEEENYQDIPDSEADTQPAPSEETFSAWDHYVNFSAEGVALAESLEQQRLRIFHVPGRAREAHVASASKRLKGRFGRVRLERIYLTPIMGGQQLRLCGTSVSLSSLQPSHLSAISSKTSSTSKFSASGFAVYSPSLMECKIPV